MPMFFEHLDKFCDVSPCTPLRSIYWVLDSQQCCFGFPRSSPHLVVIPKMILLLVQVDLCEPLCELASRTRGLRISLSL